MKMKEYWNWLEQNETLYQIGFVRERISPWDVYALAYNRPGRTFVPDPTAEPRTDYRLFQQELAQQSAESVAAVLRGGMTSEEEDRAVSALRQMFKMRRSAEEAKRPISVIQARLLAIQNEDSASIVIEKVTEMTAAEGVLAITAPPDTDAADPKQTEE